MKFTRIITNTLGTAMLAGALMLAPQAAQARVFISVGFAPPAIPVYEQPVCPGDGYIWTPGYWEYTDDGYEWVDGAWVVAPYTGALWTPGYWGYGGSGYFWNAGYWGPSVGYYGGINYGFGYFGTGFYGGYWNHNHFFYNREYNHFGGRFTSVNVYSRHVDGFDGRPGGSSFARGVSGGKSWRHLQQRGPRRLWPERRSWELLRHQQWCSRSQRKQPARSLRRCKRPQRKQLLWQRLQQRPSVVQSARESTRTGSPRRHLRQRLRQQRSPRPAGKPVWRCQ